MVRIFNKVAIFATVAIAAGRPTREEYEADKAAEQEDKDAAAAKDAKMAAVKKVVQLLEDVRAKVLEEGEKEAATYNEFACFCKDMTVEKREAIQKGEDDKEAYSTKIEECQTHREELDEKIEELSDDIKTLNEDLEAETKERKATEKVYMRNEADLSGAITAVGKAIEVVKASKKPSLAQMQSVAKTMRDAGVLADALGLGSEKSHRVTSLFLQQPDVEMEDYKFHSNDVIETLEGLQKDFRKMKADVDAEEVKSIAAYDRYKQEKVDTIKAKEAELAKTQEKRSKKNEEIAETSEKLTTTSAVLLDDQKYLSELAQICSDKAKTWDQRSQVRSDELSALTAALDIVESRVAEKTSAATVRFVQKGTSAKMAVSLARDPKALQAIEDEAEDVDANKQGAPGFLQRSMQSSRSLLSRLVKPHGQAPELDPVHEAARQAVIKVLSDEGKKFKSTILTSLASKIAADPFAKIKKLISELIDKLLEEAAQEAEQKGFCDKAQGEAKQKRGFAAERIRELNGALAENEAIRDKLANDLETLESEIAELQEKQAEAEKIRKAEKAENAETVEEAEAGLEAVEEAIDIIDKFYKTAAKEEVDLELIQQHKGPLDDMPDAGFDAGEAYTGAGGDSGGVLGMMEVIQSDFKRTIKETKKAEAEAEDEFHDFNTETGKSLAEKEMAVEQKTKQKDKAVQEIEEDSEDLDSQTAILKNKLQELLDLKPTCVDTGMSYDERVARREDEIEGLKKALCVLQHVDDPAGPAASC